MNFFCRNRKPNLYNSHPLSHKIVQISSDTKATIASKYFRRVQVIVEWSFLRLSPCAAS